MADLPAVKQCADPDSLDFGAVAVKLPEGSPLGDWGVMTLNRGGDFRRDEQVANWLAVTP